MNDELSLLTVFTQLSFVAIGGVNAIVPEVQRQVVDRHGWMTAQEFAALYALAQAAPGPNMLVSTLVGWRVAGLPGAALATFGMVGPSSALAYIASGAWHRFRARAWRRLVQAGLTPITVGLVAAGAALLTRSTSVDLFAVVVTVLSTILLVSSRLHPLWLLGAGALAGMLLQ